MPFDLQAQHLPGFRRSCGLGAHFRENSDDLLNLLCIGFGQLAAFREDAVLETHANIAAEQSRLGHKGHLMASGREYRPLKVLRSEQAIGGLFHEHQIVEVGPDPAQDAEYQLHEEGRFDQLAIDEVPANTSGRRRSIRARISSRSRNAGRENGVVAGLPFREILVGCNGLIVKRGGR